MVLYIVIGIGVLLTFGAIVAGVVVSRRGDNIALERLEQLTGDDISSVEDTSERVGQASESALTQRLDQVIEERGIGKKTAVDLARADLKLTVAEFFSLTIDKFPYASFQYCFSLSNSS